jgi:hypothetical protein
MARRRRARKAKRKNALRVDASVATGQRQIEKVFGLPKGSVRLVLRSGRKARKDKSVGALLDHWSA